MASNTSSVRSPSTSTRSYPPSLYSRTSCSACVGMVTRAPLSGGLARNRRGPKVSPLAIWSRRANRGRSTCTARSVVTPFATWRNRRFFASAGSILGSGRWPRISARPGIRYCPAATMTSTSSPTWTSSAGLIDAIRRSAITTVRFSSTTGTLEAVIGSTLTPTKARSPSTTGKGSPQPAVSTTASATPPHVMRPTLVSLAFTSTYPQGHAPYLPGSGGRILGGTCSRL